VAVAVVRGVPMVVAAVAAVAAAILSSGSILMN
jgi:hypothetical protein